MVSGFTVSFFFVFLVTPWWIRLLRRLEFSQIIRIDGPISHRQKEGTPMMGGAAVLISLLLSVLLFTHICSMEMIILSGAALLFGSIGLADDYFKGRNRSSDGLRAYQKLLVQGIGAAGIVAALYVHHGESLFFLRIPGTGTELYVGRSIFFLFAWLYIILMVNSVNLTDGLDGLAAGLSCFPIIIFVLIGMGVGSATAGFISMQSAVPAEIHLHDISIFFASLLGGIVAFMRYNRYPAQIFMGDTGSEALGGMIGTAAVLLKLELFTALISGVFLAESFSVILQVGTYKIRRKRVLLMAPLHHHFELKGWQEGAVVVGFWIFGGFLAGIGIAIL